MFIVFETCDFTLHFVLSHFLVVCKTEGGSNDTTNDFAIFSAVEGGIFAWGWDLHLGVGSMLGVGSVFYSFLFLAWLFFPHPVFVLENNGVMSHFLTS